MMNTHEHTHENKTTTQQTLTTKQQKTNNNTHTLQIENITHTQD